MLFLVCFSIADVLCFLVGITYAVALLILWGRLQNDAVEETMDASDDSRRGKYVLTMTGIHCKFHAKSLSFSKFFGF